LIPPQPKLPGLTAGVFSFLVIVAFVPWFNGGAYSPRWALIALGCAAGIWYVKIPASTFAHWCGAALIAFGAVSILWSSSAYDGINELLKFCFLGVVFLLVQQLPSMRPVYVGLAIGIAVNSAIVTAQYFGWQFVPQYIVPGGLFGNKNYVAEAAAMVLLALIYERMWWHIPAVLPATFLPSAKGAIAGLIAGLVLWVWTRSRLAAVALMLCGLVAGGILYQRGYDGTATTERMLFYKSTIAGMTWHGNGLGSFFTHFPSHSPEINFLVSRPIHAHNDILEMVYELGPGALFYLAFISFLMCGPFGAEKLMLICFLMEGCFAFPLHLPATAFMASLAAGRLCLDRSAVRRLAIARRAAARLGLAARHATRRRSKEIGYSPHGVSV
jgi:hypothetical protein